MPQLVDVAIAPPPHVADQALAAEFARAWFGRAIPHIDRLMPVFANTGIKSRRLCRPPEWYGVDHGLDEKNEAYIDAATELCATAGRELLARRRCKPRSSR